MKHLLYTLIHGEPTADLGTASIFDLLAPSLDTWNNPVTASSGTYCTMSESGSLSEGYTFTNLTATDAVASGSQSTLYTFPYASFCYDKKILLPPDAVISFDLTVNTSAASIELFLDGGRPDVNEKAGRKIVLNSLISSNVASGSGYLKPGIYTGAIRVADLIAANDLPADSNVWVSGIKVFVPGHHSDTVTVRTLSVDRAYQVKNRDIYATNPYATVRDGLKLEGETEDLTTEITGMDFYINGRRSSLPSLTPNTNTDYKKTYHTQTMSRTFNFPDGYMLDMPADWQPDYSLSALRSRFSSDTCVLTVSKEWQTTYGNSYYGWVTYKDEYLTPYLDDDDFLKANSIRRVRETEPSEVTVEGYTVWRYDLAINRKGIEMPYYSIVLIRKFYVYNTYYLLVLKSKAPTDGLMDRLLRSFKPFSTYGTAINLQGQYNRVIPKSWNDETKAYYNKLVNQNTTDWGFFSASMVDTSDDTYSLQYNKIQPEHTRIKRVTNKEYGIMPTYQHLSYGSTLPKFPSDMANEFAGGNGFNGKPVLQFTYQYTSTNNTNLSGETPIYKVLSGYYDTWFHRLAKSIKEYGKPILFRLNNEMNTDWTSYCGMVSLLDPDIFVQGWQRLYDIFEDEGVDNCIWIYNPNTPGYPPAKWNDPLCYMPGENYMQILGLTSYEMGNGSSLSSFQSMYTTVYEQCKDNFGNYPWVISEFGCGSGGEKQYSYYYGEWVDTELYRNSDKQYNWIQDMFTCLNNRDKAEYAFCRNIKGAVWFNVNDYANIGGKDYILNALKMDDTYTFAAAWNLFRSNI
ncbi:MAG: hypothetical protein IJU16_00835 [Clostridia bacterium]|nr:hypothetical protein [Clostridia bacterium]